MILLCGDLKAFPPVMQVLHAGRLLRKTFVSKIRCCLISSDLVCNFVIFPIIVIFFLFVIEFPAISMLSSICFAKS